MAALLMLPEEFHPELYFTVATVLPLLLLVASLVRVFLDRWPITAIMFRRDAQEL
jgi:hypothetical protein